MDIVELTSEDQSKLPERYIMFPNNIPSAIERINQIIPKLFDRGLVVDTSKVYRITYLKHRPKNPYAMLAFELKKK